MTQDPLLSQIDDHGVATVTLNRSEVHNAFDDGLIARLTEEIARLNGAEGVRVIRLAAAGRSFSAGADLNWMRRTAGYSREKNLRDAMALAGLMRTLDRAAKPTLALVQGAVYGGGVGLVSCCDVALAVPQARFCLSEVRLGLTPAVISPYVVAAIGARAARRYFVTAEPFDAREAWRLGLVHEVVEDGDLETAAGRVVESLLRNGPHAMAAAKELIESVANRPIDDAVIAETAQRIAERRATSEAAEGMQAFLEKRRPTWDTG